MTDFGARLRALREKRGLSQAELARIIPVHKSQLLRYEHGQTSPTAEKIVALCRALHVTADVLLRGDRKGEEPVEFGNVRLHDRFRTLGELPKQDQDVALQVLDALIAKRRMRAVIAEVEER